MYMVILRSPAGTAGTAAGNIFYLVATRQYLVATR